MNTALKLWIFALLTLVICWLTQFNILADVVPYLAQQSVLAQSTSITISLPADAEVQLRGNNETRSGKVVGMNNRQLNLQRGSHTTNIPLDTIDRVAYDRNSPFYRASGEIVIRGGQSSPTGPQDTWPNIPLSGFSIRDTNTGQARVILDSVLSSTKLRGIRSVAQNSTYAADEMYFGPQQGWITLVVTPY